MRDFKVGDKVGVVDEAEDLKFRGRSYAGELGTITEITGPYVSVRMGDGEVWWFGADELELASSDDPINHPAHYAGSNGIECIDAMRATLTPDEFRGYCKGAAFKYIWRERQKGGNESLAKAVWYLNKAQK